ncbi:hypothetical protein QLS71_010145 [Mariniflexile litorale]|uniref:Late embryogenesis abundant protein n=1 Tax=Mariniflexile litorale TaxID=3045158 RepID=A0AAU7EC05_9FLAO|nr:hypothetical protein [Mariniflexile sp. KMM 9835]MDQ8213412.1 hypothetical protein [Mariniflexile sp. KMM 9835]
MHPQSLKNYSHTFLLLLIALHISCASKKNIIIETINEDIHPKLVFLNYSISKDKNNKKSIQFINQIVTDGKLKSIKNNIKLGAIGDLKCLQLDKDSTEITSITIQNPLSKHIEFINDSLIFENKKIDLKSAPLSLRLQLHYKTKFIAINEIIDSLQNSTALIITNLD